MPTALIVEDEPAANGLLAMIVRLRGYETESAFTGGEALRKADDHRPDLVFLDLMLPDINGYEVCKTLRDRRATGDVPVVMVTARLAAENRVQGFRAGAVEYVPKPYTPDQIFGAIARADSWRGRIDRLGDEGELVVDAGDEVASLRAACDLHSLLHARTRLDEGAVRRLNATVLGLIGRGVDWGRSCGRARVATLAYRLGPGRVDLTLRDESGWLGEDDPRADGLADLIEAGGLREVDPGDGREIRLVLAATDVEPDGTAR